QRIHSPIRVTPELLAFPERQLIQTVPANPLRRDLTRIRVNEFQPLREGKVRISDNLVVCRHRSDREIPIREIAIQTGRAVSVTAGIVSPHRVIVSVEELKREAVRETALDIGLERRGVGITDVFEYAVAAGEVPVRIDAA